MTDSDSQIPGAPSDNTTLVQVLADLDEAGFTAGFRTVDDDGNLRCSECGNVAPAAELVDILERRLEGASDPDDMVLVVAGRCPSCSARGTVTVAYGPEAAPSDAAVVASLP